MKDLWRWLKIEMQYMEVQWGNVLSYLVLTGLWICVGVAIYGGDTAEALLFTVMIIAWKMSYPRDA